MLKIGRLEETLKKAHDFLQNNKGKDTKYIKPLDKGCVGVIKETNWGLEIVARTGKNDEQAVQDGDSMVEFFLRPYKLHKWLSELGQTTAMFQGSFHGVGIMYRPRRAKFRPGIGRDGCLILFVDSEDFNSETDLLMYGLGDAPLECLDEVFWIKQDDKMLDKVLLTKVLMKSSGEMIRIKGGLWNPELLNPDAK
jgi:hypothetical protein